MKNTPILSRGKIVIMIFFALLALTFLVMYFYGRKVESDINICVSNLLNQGGFSELKIKTKNRYKSPILSGSTTATKHKKVIKLLDDQCGIETLNDFVNIIIDPSEKLAQVEFETDEFNNTVSISGQLSSSSEVNEVLTIVKSNYPEAILLQNLQAYDDIEASEIAINLTLALSLIDEIELTEITLTDFDITLKGLVRDNDFKAEVLEKFNDIFANELNINDQLEVVVKDKVEVEEIEIELNKVPILIDPIESKN